MKLLIAFVVFTVAVASGSSIRAQQPEDFKGEQPFFEELQAEPVEEESVYAERSLLSNLKTAASLVSSAKNSSLTDNLKTVAGIVADVALTAATGTEEGAALAKTVIGVAGEAVVAASSALSNTSLANNTLAQALLNGTSDVGELLSEYGSGNETVAVVLTLVTSVTSGNMTLTTALKTAGVYVIDDTLSSTKEKISAAGTTLEVVGGLVETLGSSMSDSANSSTEAVLENIFSTLGADSIINATFSAIDSALNITLEDIISEKLSELDDSTATLKEKVVSAGEVLTAVGSALVTIGDTFEDLGDSSVTDYVSIIKEALSELTSSSSTSSDSS